MIDCEIIIIKMYNKNNVFIINDDSKFFDIMTMLVCRSVTIAYIYELYYVCSINE